MSGSEGTLVVGGGVIGLSVGWQLARAGEKVTVLERDSGDGARSAAAVGAGGMMAPIAEAGFHEHELLALGRASAELYPKWTAELEAAAGQEIGYRTEGTLLAALDRDDAAWLRRLYENQQRLELESRWLTAAEALEMEPQLSPRLTAAVFAPGDHQVDAGAMLAALRVALLGAGGEYRSGAEALRIELRGDSVRGVRVRVGDAGDSAAAADEDLVACERVVVCAGAWTGALLRSGVPECAVPPMRPVKGQILTARMSELLSLSHVVRGKRVYLVPKADGRLLIGATSEELGFDTRITAGAAMDLLREAWEAAPGLYELELEGAWAGLRPATRDNAPALGATCVPGLYLATGHYRHGVMLAPITAYAMRELLLEGSAPEVIRPFGVGRFHE